MRTHIRTGLLVAALFAHGEAVLAQVPLSTGYHTVDEAVLGGEGGWDYLTLDANGLRLYISRSTHVSVVDPESRKEVGTIPDTPGVHGIALAPELGKGYTSNGRDATVTVFDLRTLRQLSRISVGTGARCDATAFDPKGGLAFAANGDGSLTVIREGSPGKFVVVENVKTRAGARTMALDSQRQRIYLVTAEYGQKPPATNDKPNPRTPIVPSSFTMLTLAR